MMKTLSFPLLLLALLLPVTASAQKEFNIWCLGGGAGIDFNGAVPVPFDCALNTLEGSASVADRRTGEVLFYTDGDKLYNRAGVIMANAGGMKGNINSTQGALIVPMPGDEEKYYLFTSDAGAYDGTENEGIYYSIIDMKLDGGLGAVTLKNVPLLSPATEKLTAIRHRDGCSYWVLVHGWENNRFVAYHVTSIGVDTDAVISDVGSVHRDPTVTSRGAGTIGYMKASPNGRRLAVALFSQDHSEIFDFDDATGVVSNPIALPSTGQDYGVSFSPDNTKLYVASLPMKLFQFDVRGADSAAIAATRTLVFSETDPSATDHFGALQIAPDGRIYHARLLSRWLGVIPNPNAPGAACGYIANGFDLGPGKEARLGLPNFIDSYFAAGNLLCGAPFARFLMNDTICTGDSALVVDQSSNGPESWSWSFTGGEPAGFSGAVPPRVVYNVPGNYRATLTVSNAVGSGIYVKNIVVMPRGELRASIGRDYQGNAGDTFRIPVMLDAPVDAAHLDDLIFTLRYRPALLRLDTVITTGKLLAGWRIDSMLIARDSGIYRVRLTPPPGGYLTGAGQLMMLELSSYLDSVDTCPLDFELRSTQNACMYATVRPGLVHVAVCGYRTRAIVRTGPDFTLDRNRPDPFNATTRIDFTLGIDGPVTLVVYDAMGRRVATLVDGPMEPGAHTILWDASAQPAGVYYYRLVAGEWSKSGRMVKGE
jgi:PKD repeat protein